MWELRGWSGWKLAVFPRLEILLFLSFPFLWVHPLWVYPPGRVVLFPSFFSTLAFALSSLGFLLLLFLSFLQLPGGGVWARGFPSSDSSMETQSI